MRFFKPGEETPGFDMSVKIWDTTNWAPRSVTTFHRPDSGAASLSPDSRILIIERDPSLLELLDISSGASLGTFAAWGTEGRPVVAGNALLASNDSLLLQGSGEGVRVWHTAGYAGSHH